MVIARATFSNPASTSRVAGLRTVLHLARGQLNFGDQLFSRKTGTTSWAWVDWTSNRDETGEAQLWGDGSYREVVVWLRSPTLDADSRTEFEFEKNVGVQPSFALDLNVTNSVGAFLSDRRLSNGFDLNLDIDPGSARSDPKSVKADGSWILLFSGHNVRVFRWQVRSGDGRHIWTAWLEFYHNLPYALFDAMESFSTPSTTDWLDNMTVGWRVSGANCWPLVHQETLRMSNPGTGNFAAWNRDYGGSGNVMQGQGCGFRMELWFRDPSTYALWSTIEKNTYDAIIEYPRCYGVAKEWRTQNAYGPRGRVPDPPPQFASFAAMQAAERTRAKAHAKQGVSHPQNVGGFYHDLYGGNVQTRDTASDTVHGHARAISVVMSDEATFLERIANAVTQENCRPGWLYEDGSLPGTNDGDLVSNLTRPSILLWDGLPFIFRFNDPWGKTSEPNRSLARGGFQVSLKAWQFWDRQHYSAGNAVALATLTGDWVAKHQVSHHREHLRSVQPDESFRQYNIFATEFEASREVGRCIRAAAWIQRHFPEERFRLQIGRRITNVLGQSGLTVRHTFNRQFAPNFENLWQFASQITPHELTALEHDFSTINNPVPNQPIAPEATGILYWEEGIMCDGLFSWWSVDPSCSRAFDLGLQTAENCVLFGFFEDTQTALGGRGRAAGGFFNPYHAVRMSGDANLPVAGELPPTVQYEALPNGRGGRGPIRNSTASPGSQWVWFRVYYETPRWAIPAALFTFQYTPVHSIRQRAARILKGYFATYRSLPGTNTWHEYGDTDMAWVPTAGFDPWTENYDTVIGGGGSGAGGSVIVPSVDPIVYPPNTSNPGNTTTGPQVVFDPVTLTWVSTVDPLIIFDPNIPGWRSDPGVPPLIIFNPNTSSGWTVVPTTVQPVYNHGGGIVLTYEPTTPLPVNGAGGTITVDPFDPLIQAGSGGNGGSNNSGICSLAVFGQFASTHVFRIFVHSVGCLDVSVSVVNRASGYSEVATLVGQNAWEVNLLGQTSGIFDVTAECDDAGSNCDPALMSFAYVPPMTDATALWAAVRATYPSDGLLQLTNTNNRRATTISDPVGEQAAQRVIDIWPLYAQAVYDSSNAAQVEVAKVGVIAMLYEQGNVSTRIAQVKFTDVFGDGGMIEKVKATGPRARTVPRISRDRQVGGRERAPWAAPRYMPPGILPNDLGQDNTT